MRLGLLELRLQLINLLGFLLKGEFESIFFAFEFDAMGFFDDMLLGKLLDLFLELKKLFRKWV